MREEGRDPVLDRFIISFNDPSSFSVRDKHISKPPVDNNAFAARQSFFDGLWDVLWVRARATPALTDCTRWLPEGMHNRARVKPQPAHVIAIKRPPPTV